MPRTEVLRYAEVIEKKLQENDQEKGSTGWKGCDIGFLLSKLDEEVNELKDIVNGLDKFDEAIRVAKTTDAGLTKQHLDALNDIRNGIVRLLGKEAADVGNICMMISDVCGALKEEGQC